MLRIYALKTALYPVTGFSWKLEGDCNQTAYQLMVYDSNGQEVWNSGKVESENRHNIPCDADLGTYGMYTWKVRVWGESEECVEAEGPTFATPITQWKAKWVEPDRVRKPLTDKTHAVVVLEEQDVPEEKLDPAVCMRQTFTVEELPEKALLYATARGVYKLWVNGNCVSDLLAPGFTAYSKRIDYQCYDVQQYLQTGENVIDITLADGWYTGKIGALGIGQQFGTENAMLFQLDMSTATGVESVCSGTDTLWSVGPWTYADLIVGEGYDQTKACEEWTSSKVCDYAVDNLTLQSTVPMNIIRTLVPTISYAPNGDLLLDAGETVAGFISFDLEMKAGERISLEYTETLDVEGNFLRNIIGQNKNQTDVYTAAVDGMHHFEPSFTFHGFRYVRIKGTQDMNPEHYKVLVVGSPMDVTGSFTCNDPRLNQLQENIVRSQQGNMISIPTDCPQREKTGWLGDMQIYAPTAAYEMDVEHFLRHWLVDMAHDQRENGEIPHIVPYFPSHDVMRPPWINNDTSAGWSDAAIIVPWRLYEAYGDVSILEENFPMMKKYMDSVEGLVAQMPPNSEDFTPERKARMQYIWNTGFHYGDWLMPSMIRAGKSSIETAIATGHESSTLMYAYTTSLMVKMCKVLGKEDLAAQYQDINDKVRKAFVEEFMDEEGRLAHDFQGLYILALAMDAVPQHLKDKVIGHLERLVHANEDRLDTGFLSVAFILPVLYQNGLQELANTILFQDACPSWLYEVKMGATTMWESWGAYDEAGNPSTYSMNHFAFGCVGEYMFDTILGLKRVEAGGKTISINPDFNCGLTQVSGTHDSIWGKIQIDWAKNEDKKTLHVVIPPNVTAQILLDGEVKTVGCGEYTFE